MYDPLYEKKQILTQIHKRWLKVQRGAYIIKVTKEYMSSTYIYIPKISNKALDIIIWDFVLLKLYSKVAYLTYILKIQYLCFQWDFCHNLKAQPYVKKDGQSICVIYVAIQGLLISINPIWLPFQHVFSDIHDFSNKQTENMHIFHRAHIIPEPAYGCPLSYYENMLGLIFKNIA